MTEQQGERFFILDGHSLAYRAFFALPLELTTKEGLHTNAVLGFTNMLLRLLKDEKPGYLAAAFDYPAANFRHYLYEEYKATRQKTPPEMSEQLPLIKEILTAYNIPCFELEGFEADDIIGACVRAARKAGMEAVIVTADADAFQLLEEGVKILITRRGISQVEWYDATKLQADYGISARQWVDFKALKGDSSDNIPGIPGVGEKKALQLLQEYGSLEEIIRCSGKIKGKLGENIAAFAEQALLGKKLITINSDLPLTFSLRDCRYRGPDRQTLMAVLRRLELNSIINSLNSMLPAEDMVQTGLFPAETGALNHTSGAGGRVSGSLANPRFPLYLNSKADLIEIRSKIEQGEAFALLPYADGASAPGSDPAGVIFSSPAGTYYLSFNKGQVGRDELWHLLGPLLENPAKILITHDFKPLYKSIFKAGIEPKCRVFDTMLAAYLLHPERPTYDPLSLCDDFCATSLLASAKEGEKTEAKKADPGVWAVCCSMLPQLKKRFLALLQEQEMDKLYYELELPLVKVLARMELRGITVRREVLSRLAEEMQTLLSFLEQEIVELAGEKFNLNSPKQLGFILFEKLGLPVVRRIKTGYSTDARTLQELAGCHPIVEKLLQYRTVSKLINTYLDGLPPLINPATGRIHTTFNQTVTATGRLSSSEPNLQNIPIRYAEGRRLREAFTVSCAGNLLLAADYSQIELRILAHLSGDENLLDAFRKDQDIHTRTAADIFNVEMEAVTPKMRNAAKAVNFGIIYGISDYGLARDLRISRSEAKQFIHAYFQRYSGIESYLNRCLALAREQGFVTTLMNRRRYLPDINHANHNRRSFAERVARNTPIQGSAADMIKAAMIAIDRELEARCFAAAMLLQVHDELIFELPAQELNEVASCVKGLMEGVISLSVPLKVDLKVGRDWYHLDPWKGV